MLFFPDEIHPNKIINDFHIHKPINKSGVFERNNKTSKKDIKEYKNNNKGINVFYST